MTNLSPTEMWRKAADEWVDADDAARMLEETKTAVLARWKTELGDVTDAKAERQVKASARWHDYVRKVVSARTHAERLKINMKYYEMKRMDQVSMEATHRVESRL